MTTPPARPTPGFPIGLIALDLDGTLIGEDLVIGPRTLAAVAAARERGVAVSIVTGRMTTSALPYARALGLVDPIVAYQGALVRALPPPADDPRLGRILAHRPLAADAAREVIAWAKSVGLEPHVNHLERFVIQADDPRAEDYSTFLGARAEVVEDLRTWLTHPISKVISVAAASDPIPESVLDAGRRRFAGRAAVTISHPRFLEFLAPGVSKLVGVRHLARRARIPLGRVLAIGDQFNDVENRRRGPWGGDTQRAGGRPGSGPIHRAVSGRRGSRPADRAARPRLPGDRDTERRRARGRTRCGGCGRARLARRFRGRRRVERGKRRSGRPWWARGACSVPDRRVTRMNRRRRPDRTSLSVRLAAICRAGRGGRGVVRAGHP